MQRRSAPDGRTLGLASRELLRIKGRPADPNYLVRRAGRGGRLVPARGNGPESLSVIVAGSRGAGGFEHLLLGSVPSQVIDHAGCRMVIVPSAH